MTGIGTFWRTVRHLKPVQIVGRARFRLSRPRPDTRPPPPLRPRIGTWIAPARRAPSLLGPRRIRLLGVERELDGGCWDDPAHDKLWRYNLHYFDDLNAVDTAARQEWQQAFIDRWVVENPPARGTGWEPYPVSLRIVNWVKYFIGGARTSDILLHSLAVQARWLCRRLEWHLLGNHLFANAKALVFAGLFFDGPEADSWLQRGLRILRRELDEQVLADGGHFERSPMYHALALEDVLDLLNVEALYRGEPALVAVLRAKAAQMLCWLRCMSHPDGRIAFFNDAADGVAPSNHELERYAAELAVEAATPAPEGVKMLGSSGYVRVMRGRAVALLDVAPVGPAYLPGHAHADTLSFELSIGARRVVVNGGTSCYGSGPRRAFERSTAAHSTVEVAGCDSSEMWSAFRVGRRARATATADGWHVAGRHDGYRFLRGAPIHERRWTTEATNLIVEDRVMPALHPAVARYHFAPGIRLVQETSSRWRIVDDDGGDVAFVEVVLGSAGVDASDHAPTFGSVVPTQSLSVGLENGRAITRWSWDPDARTVSE